MIRGSTTSIKDKVLPFPYHVCCGSAGIPSSGTEREHLHAVPGSLYVIAPRLPTPSVTQIVPFPLKGMYRSIPFHGEQRAAHCIRECWRYTANMILSQDTFSESVSAFNVSCPLFRLLAHTLIAPRGSICLLLLVPSMCLLSLAVVLHYTSHTFFLNKMFTKSATALRHSHVARFLLCCSSSHAARLLICCSRDSQHRPQPQAPKVMPPLRQFTGWRGWHGRKPCEKAVRCLFCLCHK